MGASAKKQTDAEPRQVPVEEWGKDHWSLFGYIETRCVDFKGTMDQRHLRCNPRRHPGLARIQSEIEAKIPDGPYPYPTRLREGLSVVEEHDDWDCFYDIEAAGLIEDKGTGINPLAVMTEAGRAMAGKLRAWKTKGGMFATFAPTRTP